jgi:hypothetical protein
MLQYLDTALVRGENQIAALERSKTVEGVPRYNEQDTSILEGEYQTANLFVTNFLDTPDSEPLITFISELFDEADSNPEFTTEELGGLVVLVRLVELEEASQSLSDEAKQFHIFLEGEVKSNTISIDSLLTRYFDAITKVFELKIEGTKAWRQPQNDPYDQRTKLRDFFGSFTGYIGITEAAQALRNYHLGALHIAKWLVAQFGLAQKFVAFRAVFSPITVIRSENASASSKGLTEDHTINDYFNATLTKPMRFDGLSH